jgi:hypothetical protein
MDWTFAQRAAGFVFVLIVVLGAGSGAIAQTPAAAAGGPDILGMRVGISPQEAFTLLQKIDPAHRVTVGQVPIPALLGDKAAVYAMAPENLNGGLAETINVSISVPPNPQQVIQIHRTLNQTIHTTVDQIVASLRQKYGPESFSNPGSFPNSPNMFWLYDRKGQLANPTVGAATMRLCGNNYFQFTSAGNFPIAGQTVQPGVLTSAYGVNSPFQITPIQDPAKNPQCAGWVRVNAYVQGGQSNGVYNYSLDVTITDFDTQKSAAVALSVFLNNAQNQKQQQDLNKAKQQSVPTL